MSRMQKKARRALRKDAAKIAMRIVGKDCFCSGCVKDWLEHADVNTRHDDVPHVYDANCGCDYCSSPF
jgi:hypothetical protein